MYLICACVTFVVWMHPPMLHLSLYPYIHIAHIAFIPSPSTHHPLSRCEQALFQCVIEQMRTLPRLCPWYELTAEERVSTVTQIHNIVCAQVFAISHSMLELACDRKAVRSFVERMCVIHQLTESQRSELLQHLQSY